MSSSPPSHRDKSLDMGCPPEDDVPVRGTLPGQFPGRDAKGGPAAGDGNLLLWGQGG